MGELYPPAIAEILEKINYSFGSVGGKIGGYIAQS
jgi:hypothetical protein